jgi:hypothetical protein
VARLRHVTDDPYDKDENVFRTDGEDACHWCYMRPQEFVWGPYGTRVCGYCQDMIRDGREWEVVEETASRMTVHDRWFGIDPEHWRAREHGLMQRWLKVRTTCQPLEPHPPRTTPTDTLPDVPDEPWDDTGL